MNSQRSDDDLAGSSPRIPVRVVAASLALVTILSLWVFGPCWPTGLSTGTIILYLGELARMGRFSWSSLRWMWTSLEPFYLQPIAWMTHLADVPNLGIEPDRASRDELDPARRVRGAWWASWCGCWPGRPGTCDRRNGW